MRLFGQIFVLMLAGAATALAQVPVTDPSNPTQTKPPDAGKPKIAEEPRPATPAADPNAAQTDIVTPRPTAPPPPHTTPDETTVVEPDKTPAPASPAYAGPGNLGRDFGFIQDVEKTTRFRPYVGVTGIFASGLTGGNVNPDGTLSSTHSYGIEANFGIVGTKVREKDSLALEYHGSIFHYSPSGTNDGTNQFLSMSYRRQASKNISLRLDETAGVYSNTFGVASTAATTDLSVGNAIVPVSPLTQALDDRTIFLSTSADVVYRKSARLSFDFGGTGFTVKRNLSSLYGVIGSEARADAEYRLTRRATVGAYYTYTHYEYSKAFGGSNINTAGASVSYAVNRSTEIRVRGGFSHVQTAGLVQFNLDPLVAALLGQAFGVVAVDRTNIIPDASVQILRRFRNGAAGAEVLVGVSPGNGLYLTSKRVLYNGHIDYNGFRKYAMSVGVTREQLGSLGVALGNYDAYGLNVGASRDLTYNLHSNARFEYRRYNYDSQNAFLRNPFKISLGIAWSPGDRPLTVW